MGTLFTRVLGAVALLMVMVWGTLTLTAQTPAPTTNVVSATPLKAQTPVSWGEQIVQTACLLEDLYTTGLVDSEASNTGSKKDGSDDTVCRTSLARANTNGYPIMVLPVRFDLGAKESRARD